MLAAAASGQPGSWSREAAEEASEKAIHSLEKRIKAAEPHTGWLTKVTDPLRTNEWFMDKVFGGSTPSQREVEHRDAEKIGELKQELAAMKQLLADMRGKPQDVRIVGSTVPAVDSSGRTH
jgi:hypothetical protein